MPRVKPLITPDPLELDLSGEIASGMAKMKINIKDLSEITGINYSTLVKRIGRGGDIKTMRIGELIRIRKALKR